MPVVIAQAFNDPAQFEFVGEAFIDEKPENYAVANNTNKMTRKELMTMYYSTN